MGKTPKVVLIVINWNELAYTIKCINSLLKVDYSNKKIILLDNGSKGNDYEELKKLFPQITMLKSKTNLGYAGGSNLCVKYAQKFKPKYFQILNNDMIFDKYYLKKLVEVAEKDNSIGVIGPKMNYMDYPKIIWSGGGNLNTYTGRSSLYFHKQKDIYQKNPKIIEVDYALGLIRNSIYKKIGLFDNNYFAYCEETDFCLRVKRLGYSVKTRLDSTMYHKVSLVDSKIGGFSTYYITRNRFYLMKKNFSLFKRLIFYVYFVLIDIPKFTILYPILSKNLSILRIFYSAIWDGITGKLGRNKRFS